MRRVLALPLSTVERAGTGDLVSRTTADVDALARTIRFAVPETLIAAITTVLTLVAALLVDPLVALPIVTGLPIIWVGTRWYLRRAPAGYLWERAAYATMTGTVGETVDGGRTVDALGLGEERVRRVDADLADAFAPRGARSTCARSGSRRSRSPTCCRSRRRSPGAAGSYYNGQASIGAVTAVALYVQQLADPVDRLISWLDEIQVGATSFARLVGVSKVPDDRSPTGEEPAHERLRAEDVRYAYSAGRDVLHGIDLDLSPGERVAVVGPSGAGKSTLGRLLAGIHRRAPAASTSAASGSSISSSRRCGARSRSSRRSSTSSSGRSRTTCGSLGSTPTDEELERVLAAVDALPWARALPDGLETVVGAGGHPLSPPQQQQVALARLVLADPHTLVLDEATSLLDPAPRATWSARSPTC